MLPYLVVVELGLLGPLSASDGRTLALGGPKQRTVLAHLLLRANRYVTQDQLIDLVWEDEPPPTARGSLHAYVSRLRVLLGSERIEGRAGSYVLHAAPHEIDSTRFEMMVEQARRIAIADPAAAASTYRAALGLWRGPALADISEVVSLRPAVVRLEELRLAVVEELMTTELALGRHRDLVAELEALVEQHPYREQLCGQLMVALYRSGRQQDALEAFRRVQSSLGEELGLDPWPELRRLRDQVLRQEPALDLASRALRGYRLIEQVGEGTFGTVHRAYQAEIGREVAVKAVRPALANDPEYIRRFAAEAELVARMEHPHVVPLHDYWREPDGAFLVMRYMRGGSLRAALADAALPPQRVVRMVEQLALALAYLHRQGVAHRDVKPANVLFDEDGNAYLADVGIARDLAVRGVPGSLRHRLAAYESPEEARGERAEAPADIYNLAVVVFEALAGRHPFADAPPEALSALHSSEPLPSLTSAYSGLPGSVDAVLARASSKNPSDRPADAVSFAEELRAALAPLLGTPPVRLRRAGARNPYKGLRAFREVDAADFHGRGRLVADLVARLGTDDGRFLVVVGPSGSGKSSLVNAGLLPALRQGAVPGSATWFPAQMRPGARPFEELATALNRVSVTPQSDLAGTLRGGRTGLVDAAAGVLPDADATLLLVIDQFEEVFTLVEDDDERARFLDVVAGAATGTCGRVRVVATMRADFYDLPLGHPAVAELTSRGTCSVTPLLPGEIERAINAPAEAVGVSVEPALLAALVADVSEGPSSLPLLQYALTELFEHREGGQLTLAAYEAIGGVAGALATRAEQLYAALPAAAQLAARQLFLRLVTVHADSGEYTRRRESRAQLDALGVAPEAMAAVIDALGAGRLLTFDRDPVTRAPTVEVAHEALMREWSRLRGWLDVAREDVLAHRRLAAAAREWDEDGDDASALLRGDRLRRFEEWAQTSRLALTETERQVLAASADRRAQEQAEYDRRASRERALERRSLVRLRAGVAVAAVLAVLASLLAVVALDQRSRATAEASAARARELAAAALATIGQDPELSTLLALEAVAERGKGGEVLREAEESLHRAVQNLRVVRRFPQGGSGLGMSSDGTRIVTSGSGSHEVPTVWHTGTGARLLELREAVGTTTATMSPDGRVVATTDGRGGDVRLWDSADGSSLGVLLSGPNPLSRLTFSRDGKLLAAAGLDGTARVWTVADRREAVALRGGDSRLLSVAVSPDGSRVAAGGEDATVRVWDARTGAQLAEMPGHEWPVSTVAFSPDGRSVASGAYDAEARIWDVRTGRLVRLLAGRQPVQALSFSPDGARLLTAASDATATVWDLSRGREVLRLVGHSGGPVADAAFLPDGERVLTSGLDGTTRLWDVSARGARDWLTVRSAEQIYVGVTFSPDGSTFAAPAHPHGVAIWSTATGRELRRLTGPPQKLSTVAFSADGTRLVAGSDVTSAPPVWDVRTGKLLFTLAGGDAAVRAVTFSPDGSRIATAGIRGAVRVWDARTGTQLVSAADVAGDVLTLRYSPDGAILATGEGDAVTLRDADSLAAGRRLGRFAAPVSGLAFGPDDTLVASGEDGTARVLSLTSGRELVVFQNHRGPVNQVAVSSDGRRVASSGEDGTTRLWDLATGAETLRLVGHTSLVYGVDFSPDARLLATASPDGTVALHSLRIDVLVELARSRLTRDLSDDECGTYLHVATCPKSRAGPTRPARR